MRELPLYQKAYPQDPWVVLGGAGGCCIRDCPAVSKKGVPWGLRSQRTEVILSCKNLVQDELGSNLSQLHWVYPEYRGTSLIGNSNLPGPYRRPMRRVLASS